MDAAAWRAEFARREAQYLFERAMRHAGVAAKIAAERASVTVKAEIAPMVLETWEADEDDLPTTAQRVVSRAQAAGWTTRTVASIAAVPTIGLVNVVTVRCRRHDERLWAAWRNGGFDVAWYSGPSGLEKLGWARLGGTRKTPLKVRGVLDAIEGIRGPRQWLAHFEALEREQTTAVIRVLDTSLGRQ